MKTTNFTIDEAVAICALYMGFSDGELDDTEVSVIVRDTFFAKHNAGEHVDLFVQLVKRGNLLDLMKDEFPQTFSNCDYEFKHTLIKALIQVIIADGEVAENEVSLLNFVGGLLGLSGEQVSEIIES